MLEAGFEPEEASSLQVLVEKGVGMKFLLVTGEDPLKRAWSPQDAGGWVFLLVYFRMP
mgnify:CR=1 FL=1